jgi:hypothetical protein
LAKPARKAIEWVQGKELEFLTEVQRSFASGPAEDLRPDIVSIALGTLSCCQNRSIQISGPAFAVLSTLLDAFSECFVPSLPKVVGLLLSTTGPNLGTANAILGRIPRLFECNQLLDIALGQPVSSDLLGFIHVLLREPGIHWSDERATRLLAFLAGFRSLADPTDLAKIGVILNQLGHGFESRPEFEDLAREFCPEKVPEVRSIAVPKFAVNRYKAFKTAISNLIMSSSKAEWNSIRSRVMRELASGLLSHSHDSEMLKTLEMAVTLHEPCELPSVLPAVFGCKGNEAVLDLIIGKTPIRDLILAVGEKVSSDQATITFLDRILEIKTGIAFADVEPIVEGLKVALANETAEVRQAAVFCFVRLESAFPEESAPVIGCLPQDKQKLISIYARKTRVAK